MNNNDRLLRLRYAVDIKDTDLIEAFKLGGLTISKDELHDMLTKVKPASREEENVYLKPINNQKLDAFLNGFIVLKRGPQEVIYT